MIYNIQIIDIKNKGFKNNFKKMTSDYSLENSLLFV